jgi:predicted nucleic acid-binding protein
LPSGRGLIDTSVAVDLATIDRSCLPAIVAVSSLTLAELVIGPLGADDELKRARRQQHLQYVEANVEPLSFDSRCSRAYGPVYAAVANAGRKPRGARVVDLMIAATALAHGLPLYTRNAKDLHGLEGLIEIVDVGA